MQTPPDWLYALIFEEINTIIGAYWNTINAVSEPRRFYVKEYTNYNQETLFCFGMIRNMWLITPKEILSIPEGRVVFINQTVTNRFYADGQIDFHITKDNSIVFWNVILAPRYGFGKAHRVMKEGNIKKLAEDPHLGVWVC